MQNASFHHVHLNATDLKKSISYYQKFYGAIPIRYRNREEVLLTERSFLFFNKVGEEPVSHEGSSLWHIGWSGVDGPSEYNWRVKEGAEVHTPINPLKDDHWMYFYGPNKEVVELFTGNKNHRFEHIHLLAKDVDGTTQWFKDNLGLIADFEEAQPWPNNLFKWNKLYIDNVNIMINGRPEQERTWYPNNGFIKTDGSSIDHIAFSCNNIESMFKHINGLGTEIVQNIAADERFGFQHFYIRNPDGLLIEVVEERPIPQGIWM